MLAKKKKSENIIEKEETTFLESKKEKVKNRIKELLVNSSAHGIPNILRENRLCIKAIWLIFFIASTSLCAFYTIDSIADYMKFNTITTVKITHEQSIQFPTVTLCAYPQFNNSIEEIIFVARFEKVTIDVSQFFEEFFHIRFGKCFRFNSGKNISNETIDFVNSTKTGFLYGFHVNIYLEIPEEYDFGEVLLNIHNHSSPPFDIENQGFWIKTGSWNHFGIERVFREQLGEPYNECLKNVSTFKGNMTIINYIISSNRVYSQSDCFYQCSRLHALEESNCGCNSTLSLFDADCIRHFEKELEVTKCVDNFLHEFRKKFQFEKCQSYCPLECDSISYQISSHFEPLPTSGRISQKRKKEYGLGRFETYEEVNKNYICLFVYYKELKYTLISQEPKTVTFNLVSSVGGILGLFLGISFISFIELFEIFLEVIFILFKK